VRDDLLVKFTTSCARCDKNYFFTILPSKNEFAIQKKILKWEVSTLIS